MESPSVYEKAALVDTGVPYHIESYRLEEINNMKVGKGRYIYYLQLRLSQKKMWLLSFIIGLSVFALTRLVLGLGYAVWTSPLFMGSSGSPGKTSSCGQHHKEFKWSDINPSRELIYTPCFGGHQCARLDVPMDWNSTNPDGERIAIAIVRLPAKVDVTDERYGGAIITNPGGPGGSGVGDLLRRGAYIQKITDASALPPALESSSANSRYFDIISFDPRGVNSTTPHLSCFHSDFEHQRFLTTTEAIGHFGSSNVAFGEIYSRTIAFAETCTQKNNSLLHHMNTAPVVADMVAMIEAHGRWREEKVRISIEQSDFRNSRNKAEKDAIIARTAYKKSNEKLQYWGFSYGTLLGATFASLQPNRVGRLIIDGVVNSTDYYEGKWLSNLQDSDQIIYAFGEYCHQAGPERCALWRKSPAMVLQELERVLHEVWDNPVPAPGTAIRGPEIITYSDVMSLIRLGLYNPIKNANRIATLVQDLSVRSGSAFADYKAELAKPDCKSWTGKPDDPDLCAPVFDPPISSGVICTDSVDLTNMTRDEFASRLEILNGQSKWMGNMWGSITLPCFGWNARPKWRLEREVGSDTSHPILLIGNTYDCVTPVRKYV